jgi:hypothetical protein
MREVRVERLSMLAAALGVAALVALGHAATADATGSRDNGVAAQPVATGEQQLFDEEFNHNQVLL